MDGWKDLEIHPYAAIIPRMLPRKYEAFKQSLLLHGQYDPIIVSREEPPRILDGRHRYWACLELGIKPTFAPLEKGLDELEFVLDQDKLHKEPTKSQDATCGYFLSRLSPVGRPRKGNENWEDVPIYNQETAAKRVGVDRKSIGHVKKVLESDSPIVEALGEGLLGGTTTINDALNIIVEPAAVQTTAMKMVQSGQAKTLARAARKINSEIGVGDSVLDPASGRPAQEVDNITIAHSGVSGLHALVNENSLDVIITTPSTDSSLVNSLQELHDFAVHALASTGVVAVIADPTTLGVVFEHLNQPGISFVAELSILSFYSLGKKNRPRKMTFHHRPVLIFGKAGCRMKAGDSVLWIPSKEGSPTPGIGRLMQMATELVLKRLAEPGQKLCDPIMLDRPHSALTALELGCPFIGASHNSGCVDLIRKAVAQSRATGKADVGGGRSVIGTQGASPSEPTNNQAYFKLDGLQ